MIGEFLPEALVDVFTAKSFESAALTADSVLLGLEIYSNPGLKFTRIGSALGGYSPKI